MAPLTTTTTIKTVRPSGRRPAVQRGGCFIVVAVVSNGYDSVCETFTQQGKERVMIGDWKEKERGGKRGTERERQWEMIKGE